LNTVQLSNLLMSPPVVGRHRESPGQTLEQDPFIFPVVGRTLEDSTQSTTSLPAISMSPPKSLSSSVHTTDLPGPVEPKRSETRMPKGKPESSFKPSGLSLLLARQQDESQDQDVPPRVTSEAALAPPTADRDAEALALLPPSPASDEITPTHQRPSVPPRKSMHRETPPRRSTTPGESTNDLMETTPLLGHSTHPLYYRVGHDHPNGKPKGDRSTLGIATDHVRTNLHPENLRRVFIIAIRSLPAVILGSLLNILDGVSCESR
jgi:hypothetical protein